MNVGLDKHDVIIIVLVLITITLSKLIDCSASSKPVLSGDVGEQVAVLSDSSSIGDTVSVGLDPNTIRVQWS